jgi:hypothetical protein
MTDENWQLLPGRIRLRQQVTGAEIPIPEAPEQAFPDLPYIPRVPGTDIPLYSVEHRRRLKKVTWSVLINSLVRAERPSQISEVGGVITGAANSFFNGVLQNDDRFLDTFGFVERGVGWSHIEQGGVWQAPSRADIQRIDWSSGGIETGNPENRMGNRIHFHGTLTLWFFSPYSIHINLRRLTQYFNFMCTTTRDQNIEPQPPSQYKSPLIRGMNIFTRAKGGGAKDLQTLFYQNKELLKAVDTELKRRASLLSV